MAMKAYKSYKNVDLPWLKRVPEHWKIASLARVAKEQKIKKPKGEHFQVLSLSYGKIIKKKDINFGLVPKDYDNYQLLHPGNIVLRFTDLQNDHKSLRTGLVTQQGIITSAYVCIDPIENPAYIHYLLHHYDTIKLFYGMGNGIRQSIGYKDISDMRIPVPPKEEQDQIVRYLDWQNSRLNKLINAKKKEIALLEEQKQALISQAVTKGLDPHAPLKDSGIDWIGKIPEHWLLCNLKYLCSMKSGKNLTSIQITENGPYPVYGGNGVRGYYSQYNVSGECLIIGRQGALCGNVHYVHEKIWATDHAVVTQVYNFIHLKFFYYLLTAMNLNRYASQTAAQPGLAVSNILNQKVCFPPINEQRKIAVYLEHQCIFIDNLINNINKTISFLQEYRTRLVADVVTGQIDVRNIAIPNYETVPETIDQPETAEESAISAEDQ